MQVLLFIVGILLFIGLVLIHEFGHFIVARRNGVEAEEFGLGLPPRAKSKKLKSGLLLSLNWLPLGGFVKLKGEHDDDDEPHSFGAASYWKKTKILMAGIGMNLLAGLVLLTILAWVGLPKLITPDTAGQDQFTVKSDEHQVDSQTMIYWVEPGSPAAKAGLKERDVIKSISSGDLTKNVAKSDALRGITAGFAGQKVTIEIKRGGQMLDKTATLLNRQTVEASRKTNNPKGYLGVVPTGLDTVRYSWSAPVVAVGFTKQLTVLTAKGLWHALQGLGSTIAGTVTVNHQARENGQTQATEQVGGPVAIVDAIWSSGTLGLNFMVMLIAIISISLALINVLPIPALDGGRLFVITIARAFRKRLKPQVEEWVNGLGMIAILLLAVLITIVDVHRFF